MTLTSDFRREVEITAVSRNEKYAI